MYGITIEDLKENKAEIIEQIKDYTTDIKKVMEYMVMLIDEHTCIRQLTLDAVKQAGYFNVSDNTNHYTEASLRQRSSSLR